MKKEFKKFKSAYLNELSAPDDSTTIKSQIGITSSHQKVTLKKKLYQYRKPLIAGLSTVLCALIIVITSVVVVNYRNTPVYQGMLAEEYQDYIDSINKAKLSTLSVKPFSFDSRTNLGLKRINETFENEIIEDIGVVLQDGISLYANPNEEIVITVQINNPKSFEILSFTLNGRLYQSYEFLDGSNSTQILVKFTCQDTSGIQTITIDAIKYVDDTTIKNARFGADRIIQVGLTYQNIPNVSNINKIIDTTNFGLTFVVEDIDNIINNVGGLNIYLFDETKLLNVTPLTLGRNVIPYSNLRMGSTYTYIIVGAFDLFDGAGKKGYVLKQETFSTKEGFAYSAVTSAYDSITIDYEAIDLINGELETIELFKQDELIDSINVNEVSDFTFRDLKSNTEYLISTAYRYKITENNQEIEIVKKIEYTITTQARPLPTVGLIISDIKHDEASIAYDIIDTTTVGKVIKVELYNGGELIRTFDEAVLSFTDLLSDQNYRVVVKYQYDLLDDTGIKTFEVETTFKTLKKIIPTAIFTNNVTFDKMIMAWVQITEIDVQVNLKAIELYKDGVLVDSKTSLDNLNGTANPSVKQGDITFNNVENGEYRIVLVYEYDLNDGKGVQVVNKDHPTADNKIGITVG